MNETYKQVVAYLVIGVVLISAIIAGTTYYRTSQNIEIKKLELEEEKIHIESDKVRLEAEVKEAELQAEVEKEVQQEKSERAWMHRMPFLKDKKEDE